MVMIPSRWPGIQQKVSFVSAGSSGKTLTLAHTPATTLDSNRDSAYVYPANQRVYTLASSGHRVTWAARCAMFRSSAYGAARCVLVLVKLPLTSSRGFLFYSISLFYFLFIVLSSNPGNKVKPSYLSLRWIRYVWYGHWEQTGSDARPFKVHALDSIGD